MLAKSKDGNKSSRSKSTTSSQWGSYPEVVTRDSLPAGWEPRNEFLNEKEMSDDVLRSPYAANIPPEYRNGKFPEVNGSPLPQLRPGMAPGLETRLGEMSATTANSYPWTLAELKHEELKQKRRKRKFWIIGGIIVFLILLSAGLIGGLIAGLKKAKSPKPTAVPPTNSTSLPSLFPDSKRADVMYDSALAIASYDTMSQSAASPNDRQGYRVFFQSLFGNVKEAVSTVTVPWQPAKPILTDAVNHTGLATYVYNNGSNATGALFYVNDGGLLKEKRKVLAGDNYWQVLGSGGINNNNIPMVGNLTSNVKNDDPQNSWDSYRIAAVYSRKFNDGPGARLFYHAQAVNGSNYVQEMMWSQKNDTWTPGAVLAGVNGNSHLTAVVDESLGLLSLFYTTGNRTIQEVRTPLGEGNGQYTKTMSIDNVLPANNADISAVASNGTTYLYYYGTSPSSSTAGIREIIINTAAKTGEEKYDLSQQLVATAFTPAGNNASIYHPIGSTISVVSGLTPQYQLFFADTPTGQPGTNTTGYSSLVQNSRLANSDVWPIERQTTLDLGREDAARHD